MKLTTVTFETYINPAGEPAVRFRCEHGLTVWEGAAVGAGTHGITILSPGIDSSLAFTYEAPNPGDPPELELLYHAV